MSEEYKEVNKNSKLDFNDPKISQGYKKLWYYFLEVVESNKFQNKILEIRKKYDIPAKGFKQGLTNNKKKIKPTDQDLWYRENKKRYDKIINEIDGICVKYGLYIFDWYLIIRNYLFRNKLENLAFEDSHDLCVLRKSERKRSLYIENENITYPITIKISPYASQRDIVDFIKKNEIIIKKHQEKYKNPKIKIGKVKKKKPAIQERNNFIYENRKLSINETKKQVEEKFGESLDYEYIGKIRSEEAKKRKEM